MGGSEPFGKEVDAVEVLFLFLEVVSDVHVVGGSELGEVDVDEVRVVDQFGLQLEKFVELGLGHVSVNAMGTESPAELCLEILGHEGGQVWNVGPLETAEEVPEPIRIEVIVIQCLQSAIRDSLYVFVLTEGLVEKVVVTDGVRVELGRMGGLFPLDQPAVVEVGALIRFSGGSRFVRGLFRSRARPDGFGFP